MKDHPECPIALLCVTAYFVCISHLTILQLLALLATQYVNTTLINWSPVINFGSYIFEKV